MGKQIRSILLCLIIIALFGSQRINASPLRQALNKYKNNEVSLQALKRLSPYSKLINYYSKFTFFRAHHTVSPDFIRALILAESNANPRAISTKGAMGLGQIIYPTGKQAAKELSQSNFRFRSVSHSRLANLKKEDLFDPAVNILLTCYLISKYNYKFDGRIELVISAWNAGENLKELNHGRPAPYKETHNLIGKVNSYYIDLLQKKKRFAAYRRY